MVFPQHNSLKKDIKSCLCKMGLSAGSMNAKLLYDFTNIVTRGGGSFDWDTRSEKNPLIAAFLQTTYSKASCFRDSSVITWRFLLSMGEWNKSAMANERA